MAHLVYFVSLLVSVVDMKQISEWSEVRMPRKSCSEFIQVGNKAYRTDRQTNRQTDRQVGNKAYRTDRQTDRLVIKPTRQTDRQIGWY